MLLLTSTSDKIQVVSASAASLEVHASWVDNASGTITPGRTNTAAITGAGSTTDVVAAPGASTQRNVKHLNIMNDHASASTLTAVQHTDGTNVESLWEGTLLAQESVVFDAAGRWTQYDANGLPKAGAYPVATQADEEAGTSAVVFVTPAVQHFHPSSAKFWVKAGVSADIAASYNVTSLTDTGTGVMGITIANDFSGASYCVNVSVEATGTTWAVANSRECHIRNATLAAGTLSVDCIDNTSTTNLVKDPSSWHVSGYGDL